MVVSLQKGGNVSLSKEAPGLKSVVVGLRWDARATDGAPFDVDASAFICGASGKVRSDADFVFYNNPTGAQGAVAHQGDNRTGVGEGDDETIKVDLSAMPADVSKLVFAVTIHDAAARSQNFGQIANAAIRILNEAGGAEIVRYDLSEDYSIETALIFGELYRHNNDWKFRAVGQGFAGGLGPLAAAHGVNV